MYSVNLYTLLCVMIFVGPCLCYPDGTNVDSVCDTMKPNHGGSNAQTGTSPYQITFCPSWYNASSTVTVTISGITSFKGFMVQARQSASSNTLFGTFTTTPSTRNACTNKAMVHNSPTGKSKISFKWTAPATGAGNLVFLATFVQSEHTFWTKIVSSTLTDRTTVNNTEVANCTTADDMSSSQRIGYSTLYILFIGFLAIFFVTNY